MTHSKRLRLMMIALALLAVYLITGCSTSRKVRDRPRIPVCVANGHGGAMCYDGRSELLWPISDASNMVCFSPDDYAEDERWVRELAE